MAIVKSNKGKKSSKAVNGALTRDLRLKAERLTGKKNIEKSASQIAKETVEEKGGNLTLKARLFVMEYIVSRNATDAARRAGYSERSAGQQGCELLKNPKVARAIEEGIKKLELQAEVSAEWVIRGLREVAERAMTRKKVMIFNPIERKMEQKEDEETGEGVYEFDSIGANKSLELIGKHLGMFTEKVRHEGEIQGVGATIVIHRPEGAEDPSPKRPQNDRSEESESS